MRPNFPSVLFSIVSASTAATAQDLSSYTYGNAIVEAQVRYATPQGVFGGGPPTNGPPTGPGTAILPVGSFDNASGRAIASLGSPTAGPAASAVAMLTPGPRNPAGQGVTSDAATFYAFQVTGPANLTGIAALVDMTASGTVEAGAPNGSASASLIVQDQSITSIDIFNQRASISCAHTVCTGATNFSYINTQLSVPINHIIVVYLNANANSQVPLGSSDATGGFTATLDPMFTLDVSNVQGLGLSMDPRIQQPAIPEPASYLMMLAGFAFIAIGSQWRRASF